MKITALTSCCVDFFPEQNKIYVGGNSLNFATQCKILGIDNVCVVGAIGNDHLKLIRVWVALCIHIPCLHVERD